MSENTQSNDSLNRRQFLGSSARNAANAAAGAVGLAQMRTLNAGTTSSGRFDSGSPSETVRVGVVGLRNQGHQLLKAFGQVTNCELAAVCDADLAILGKAANEFNSEKSAPAQYADFHQLLDDKSIDAVVIATPDHHHAWMTAHAIVAQKHVYLETPTTHTLEQAEQLEELVKRSGLCVQTGLMHRSGAHYRSAIAQIAAGQLGSVRLARAWACVPRQQIRPAVSPLQLHAKTQDYEQPSYSRAWLGDVASTTLHPADWHYHWRWMWSFGSGELGAWGVSLLDLARWGLNVQQPVRVSAVGGNYQFRDARETPDTLSVQYDFGETSILWEHRQGTTRGIEGRPHGVAFYGEKGTLIVDRSGWKIYDQKPSSSQPASDAQVSHAANFVAAIQQRAELNAPFSIGAASSRLVHLGNQAYREKREIHIG